MQNATNQISGAAGAASRSNAADRVRLEQAVKRVAAIEGFYIHLAAFAAVLIGLFALNWASGEEWWVQWVFAGWGIGVAAHAFSVFGRAPTAIRGWEQRKLREYMRNP